MHGHNIDACIETVCARGCREVRKTIGILERGGYVEDVAVLSNAERCAVLAELKAIMAVYDARP